MSEEYIVDIFKGCSKRSVFSQYEQFLGTTIKPEAFKKKIDEYLAHCSSLTDDRAIVLAGSLCVEDSLDSMINAFFVTLKDQFKDDALTFSFKIKLLRACKLIPSHILLSCDVIHDVRNEFAHKLDIKVLTNLSPRVLKKIDDVIGRYTPEGWSFDFSAPYSGRFTYIVHTTCMGLYLYTSHVKAMREFIDSEDFQKSLIEFSKRSMR